jgi:hypothetical protein
VATDWGPVVQTGIGASAALAGAFIGAWAQAHNQHRMDRNRRREQAGAVLAEVRALLTDIEPDPFGLFITRETLSSVLSPLQERWQRARIPLLTLAVTHPAEQVRDLARQLERSASAALNAVAVFASDVAGRDDHTDSRQVANQRHQQASSLLTQLEEAIQRA